MEVMAISGWVCEKMCKKMRALQKIWAPIFFLISRVQWTNPEIFRAVWKNLLFSTLEPRLQLPGPSPLGCWWLGHQTYQSCHSAGHCIHLIDGAATADFAAWISGSSQPSFCLTWLVSQMSCTCWNCPQCRRHLFQWLNIPPLWPRLTLACLLDCRLAALIHYYQWSTGFPGHLTLDWLLPLSGSQRGLWCCIRQSYCSQILHHCLSLIID